MNRGFEKHRFEPVNDRALCARAGIVLPVQHERSEVVGPVGLEPTTNRLCVGRLEPLLVVWQIKAERLREPAWKAMSADGN